MATWSGLRKQVRERLIPEAQSRFDLHYTLYESKGPDRQLQNSRFWVTLDGDEIFSTDYLNQLGAPDRNEVPSAYLEAVKTYLNMSIDAARRSSVTLHRALAFLDQRTGARALRRYTPAHDEHPLVRECFRFRMKLASKNRA